MSERCRWCGEEEIYVAYHDHEWGVPEYDSRTLWEKLILDGFQAGLSWITILRKRPAFRVGFAGFDPNIVAEYGQDDIERLVQDKGIVRHRGKIKAAIGNARAWQKIESGIGFEQFLWRYVDGEPLQNNFASDGDIPASTALSARISKDLKVAGFRFCGPTIVYAFMEAVGMVNDHVITCPCHRAVQGR